ncbi:hypothetical protein ABPG75_001138 [Micractinium tetrahymenae]
MPVEFSVRFRKRRQDFFEVEGLAPIVVTPNSLPAGVSEAPVWDLRGSDDEVYLWHARWPFNYYHSMGEYMPTLHGTLCKHMGRCTYGSGARLQLIQLQAPEPEWQAQQAERAALTGRLERVPYPPYYDQALACFSPAPMRWINDTAIRDRLVLVRRALVGVGGECRAVRTFSSPDFRPLAPRLYASYRARMGACLGFDPGARAPVQPRPSILLVDRRYESDRHIINLQGVVEALQRRYGGGADVRLAYMEGLTVREQAQLWNRQSIVIHLHGAALGSWAFLPHGAVAVQVSTQAEGNQHDTNFSQDLVTHLRPVTNVSCVDVANTDVHFARRRSEELFKDPVWQTLTAEQKIELLEHGRCSPDLSLEASDACMLSWLLWLVDIIVPTGLLLNGTDAALRELYGKRGVPSPPEETWGSSVVAGIAGAMAERESWQLRRPVGASSASPSLLACVAAVPLLLILFSRMRH